VLWILEFDAQETWLMTYLIVEVAQQSKARRKDDFLIAFSPVIAELLQRHTKVLQTRFSKN
jgi:hypothetical protein